MRGFIDDRSNMARDGSGFEGDEYLKLMQTIALPEYRAMRGNRRA
jgi:hypothetical protein